MINQAHCETPEHSAITGRRTCSCREFVMHEDSTRFASENLSSMVAGQQFKIGFSSAGCAL